MYQRHSLPPTPVVKEPCCPDRLSSPWQHQGACSTTGAGVPAGGGANVVGGAVVVACTDVLGRGGGGGGGAGAGSGLVGSMHTFHVSNVGSTCSPPGESGSPSLGAGLVGSPQFPFQWTANEGGIAASMPVRQHRSRCMRLVIFARRLSPCTAGGLKLLSLSRLPPMSLRSACSQSAQPDIASAAVSVIPSRQLRPTVVSGLRCARRSSLLPQTCSSAIV